MIHIYKPFYEPIAGYKNNRPDLTCNVLRAFKQLEAAEVDPSLLAYSIILGKDTNNYRTYTPQYKIGKCLNKESGSLIKYYKTGQEEDGYKGYSTDYKDLNIDIYKLELWNLLKEILRLLDCDIQKLENEIFQPVIEEYSEVTTFGNIYINKGNKKNAIDHKKAKDIQRNESLDKYRSLPRIVLAVGLPGMK